MFGRRDERVVYSDATLAEPTPSRAPSALDVILPEVGLVRSLAKGHKGVLLLILVGFAVFAGGILLAISWMNGKDAKAGHRGADRFATALVHDDPGLAPAGADDYVSGVRAYFGPVSSAKVIAGHERGVNSKYKADERTYYVIEMLIQTRRGPAALELDFDDGAIGSERISGIHELKPSDTPGLTGAEREQLASAFAERGGKAAGADQLTGALTHVEATKPTTKAPTPPPTANHALDKAMKELSCVRNAHGDVAKMQACTK